MAEALWRLTAVEAVAALREGTLTPSELIAAALQRAREVEPAVNALPTLCAERAQAQADALARARPEQPGPGYLYGLPLAIKDLTAVSGVRTTFGSRIFAEHVPAQSDILVRQLERNGGIVLAKSNTPEFGAGSNTFNEVFGATRNPWNTAKTCGGSSGGAAVALATGEAWLAHGSDLGGSLRIPAAFCSVVGLRPTPGRVARGPTALPFDTLSVNGPMARNVPDLALFLDAMSGAWPEDPLSFPAPEHSFQAAVAQARPPRRVAWSADLGIAPVDREVRALTGAAARWFESLGTTVEEAVFDLGEAQDCFQALRAANQAVHPGALLAEHREYFKPDLVWNIEKGLQQPAEVLARARQARTRIWQNALRFFETYDLLLCPTVMVPPFDVETLWVQEVEGVRFDNYVDWLMLTYALTLTACPSLSLPCGFTAQGLPVGLQLLAPPRGEAALLQAARLFEAAHPFATMLPIEPRSPAPA